MEIGRYIYICTRRLIRPFITAPKMRIFWFGHFRPFWLSCTWVSKQFFSQQQVDEQLLYIFTISNPFGPQLGEMYTAKVVHSAKDNQPPQGVLIRIGLTAGLSRWNNAFKYIYMYVCTMYKASFSGNAIMRKGYSQDNGDKGGIARSVRCVLYSGVCHNVQCCLKGFPPSARSGSDRLDYVKVSEKKQEQFCHLFWTLQYITAAHRLSPAPPPWYSP